MKRLVSFTVILAVLFGSPMMAFAQQSDDNHQDEHHDDPGPPPSKDHRGQYLAPRYEPPKDYQQHAWHKGDRLPPTHREQRYVIADYTHYGLRPPPHGYQWVRVDNNVVLVAIASGVIADVLLNILYN